MFSYQSVSIAPLQNEKIYALVDCAIDERIYRRLAFDLNTLNHANLFSGTFASGAEKYAPVLIDLEHVSIHRQAFMQKLLTACEGQPLLSFISARGALDAVADHLRQLLKIKTADDQIFLLRYSDNRMLPAIYSVLTDVQRGAFLGPIGKWYVADHWADVTELTQQTAAPDINPTSYPLQLDDQQFALLLERTELHAMVAQLEQAYADFFKGLTLVERIQFVERNSKHAGDYGFSDEEDRVAWCVGALRGGENFFTHQQIIPLLDNALQSKNTLFDALLQLPQACWQSINPG